MKKLIILSIMFSTAYGVDVAFLYKEKRIQRVLNKFEEASKGKIKFTIENVRESQEKGAKIIADLKLNGQQPCADFLNEYTNFNYPKVNIESKDQAFNRYDAREMRWVMQVFGLEGKWNNWRASYNTYLEGIRVPTCYDL